MIRMENIQRVFQVGEERVFALRDVSLSVTQREYISIMGPPGSGKSTLLNIIGLLDRPDQGAYHLDSSDTITMTGDGQAEVRRHKIGFIFQFFRLIPRLSAADNVALPMILAGVPPRIATSGSTRLWSVSAWPIEKNTGPINYPEASGNGWPLPGPPS